MLKTKLKSGAIEYNNNVCYIIFKAHIESSPNIGSSVNAWLFIFGL